MIAVQIVRQNSKQAVLEQIELVKDKDGKQRRVDVVSSLAM